MNLKILIISQKRVRAYCIKMTMTQNVIEDIDKQPVRAIYLVVKTNDRIWRFIY